VEGHEGAEQSLCMTQFALRSLKLASLRSHLIQSKLRRSSQTIMLASVSSGAEQYKAPHHNAATMPTHLKLDTATAKMLRSLQCRCVQSPSLKRNTNANAPSRIENSEKLVTAVSATQHQTNKKPTENR